MLCGLGMQQCTNSLSMVRCGLGMQQCAMQQFGRQPFLIRCILRLYTYIIYTNYCKFNKDIIITTITIIIIIIIIVIIIIIIIIIVVIIKVNVHVSVGYQYLKI